MEIIKQISEDEFVIKLNEKDREKTKSIILAHDYLQFNARVPIYTNLSDINSPYARGNVIYHQTDIQFPIRMAQDILEHVLTKDRKYLKKEHLVQKDGKNLYRDFAGLSYKYTTDDGTKMIAIYDDEQDEYVHVPLTIFNIVKESNGN